MIIKVCGMTNGENIRQVEISGINWMGFIFYPKSPRFVSSRPDYLPKTAKRVGVFVNESEEKVINYANLFTLDYIQLHGNESPAYCNNLIGKGLKLIKAFSVENEKDLTKTKAYEGICSYYIFDTKTTAYGGSGKSFNWDILYSYSGNTPFLLSGGLNLSQIEDLKKFSHPKLVGYDINSCFETQPGIKDALLIQQFIKNLSNK